jgi:rfaE bifunctional protein nucleotidyltransferase chain/domain
MSYRDKIIAREMLRDAVAALPRPLVFTNGVFDLLHPGHVDYLATAHALGGALIIGLNSDVSARLLDKGGDRPINPEHDRALMLAGLESVSAVTMFDERTPLALLEIVRPDVYVKGGDYDVTTLAEAALVNSWGGHARAIDFLPGYSTTRLIEQIRASTPER